MTIPRAWRRPLESPTVRALLLGVIVSVLVIAVSRMGALAGWEARAIDLFVFFRDRVPTPAIVLVEIDEDAFRAMGERQPLSRRYLAELGAFLLASGARVVAFDVQVGSASEPAEDAALLTMIHRWASEIVLVGRPAPKSRDATGR